MRVAVALSGGVDSAVAAFLLKEQGYEVSCVHMVTGGSSPPGTGLSDAAEAACLAARELGLPIEIVQLQAEFRRAVVEPFLRDYLAGLTPNPCVLCNVNIKFGLLREAALAGGADRFATGHYVTAGRVTAEELGLGPETISGWTAGFRTLVRRTGGAKDQTYPLCLLDQVQLSSCLFPIGGLEKPEVRAIARSQGLSAAERGESQEICFVPGDDYRGFVRRSVPEAIRPGPVVDRAGRLLGTHTGLADYTVGQRHGLGLAAPEPLYVLGLDAGRNEITAGPAAYLWSRELTARGVVFAAFDSLLRPVRVEAAVRYRQAAQAALLSPLGGRRVSVAFDRPQRAVAPGQAVAFYRGEWLIGGGWIEAGAGC